MELVAEELAVLELVSDMVGVIDELAVLEPVSDIEGVIEPVDDEVALELNV